MDILHLYFSPNGETKKIATHFHTLLKGEIIDMTTVHNRLNFPIKKHVITIISCPVYSAQIPKPFIQIIEKITSKYIIINITFGKMVFGNIVDQIITLLPDKKVIGLSITPVNHAYKNTSTKVKWSLYKPLIEKIKSFDFSSISIPKYKPVLLAKTFEHFRTKYNYKIKINKDLCNNCGLCIQHCPISAINNDMKINNQCLHCARCVAICPQKAISGKKSFF